MTTTVKTSCDDCKQELHSFYGPYDRDPLHYVEITFCFPERDAYGVLEKAHYKYDLCEDCWNKKLEEFKKVLKGTKNLVQEVKE